MKLLQFWIFCNFFKTSFGLCQEGCLSCSIDHTCLFCDVSNFYYQQDGTCVRYNQQPFCKVIDINGNCLSCSTGYFLNLNNKSCIKVDQKNIILKCKDYGSNQNCIRCDKNFYLDKKNCVIISNKIDFCDYYISENICEQCSKGFLLNLDKRRCIQIEKIDHCNNYSLIQCKHCSQGYLLNKNFFIQQNSKLLSNGQKVFMSSLFRIMNQSQKEIQYEINQICQKIKVDNCEQILYYNQCETCIQGTFLNSEKQCVINPLPKIDNCFIYQNPTKCLKCINGYYLQSNQCTQVEAIENCQIYDGSKSKSICTQCNQNYYSTSSLCQLRQNSLQILNCKELSLNKDVCQNCDDDYILSLDGLKCFKKISNCQEYNKSITSIQELKCEKCQIGFYPENDFSCLPGSDINCEVFNSQNICLECANEYFLNDEKQCQPQLNIQNCELYSKITPKECLFCNNNFQNFLIKKFCKYQVPIDNCIEYDNNYNPLRCKKCDKGYVIQGNECHIIQIQFCAEENQGVCSKCQKGFNLSNIDFKIQCVQPLSFVQANCDLTQSDLDINDIQIHQNKCIQCLSNHYLIDFSDHNICIKNEELIHFQISSNLDQNCLKFSLNGSCEQCKIGLYLEDGKCVVECQSGVHRIIGYNIIGSNNPPQLELKNFNICVNLYEEENVSVIGLDSSFENKDELDIIIQCKQQSLPVISLDTTKYTILQPNQDPFLFVKHPILKYPQIDSCISISQLSPLQQNCQYYIETRIQSSIYGYRCIKCKHQYTSPITKFYSNSYAIQNCQLNTDCNKDDYSPGLDLIWRKLFSCHKCNDSNKIPILIIQSQSSSNPFPLTLKKYSLENLNRKDDSNDTNHNIKCLEFRPENLGYDTSDTTQMINYLDLPSHCGLGVVNTSITDGDAQQNQTIQDNDEDRIKLAHYCAACKPGYRGTNMNNIFYYIKVKCEFIEHCQGFQWFNSCSQCQSNYVYEFKNGDILYDRCIFSNDINCYAIQLNGKCQRCNKGFQINQDHVCEQIKPINCISNEMFAFKKQYDIQSINYGLYTSSQGYGCIKCNTGYTSLQISNTQKQFQCVLSSYLLSNINDLPEDTSFIKNCKNYGIKQDEIVCVKCIQNYALDINKKNCYQVSQNCEIALNKDKCSKCIQGNFLVDSQCLKQSIPFCLIPNNNIDYNIPKCIQCEPEYYLTQNQQCELGKVPNCQILENFQSQKCKKCIDGYALYQNSNKSHCYKIDESLRCQNAIIQSDQQYGAQLSCTSCIQNSDLLSTDIKSLISNTICLEFQSISHCEEYDKQQSLQNSTLNCTKCQEGYILTDEYQCVKRNYYSDFCQEYDNNQDKCFICKGEQSYLDNLGQCQPKPKGIANCFKYINLESCEKCEENYYLLNNKCMIIDLENQIQNCKFYLNENQCDQCKQNFYLTENKCIKVEAQNCLTYESSQKCSTCRQGYTLQQNDDKVDCILFNKPNCLVYEQTNNNPCLICATNYYSNAEGNCQLSNVIINNCIQYEQEGVCKKCEKNYTLTLEKNNCVSLDSYTKNYDVNCQSYINQITCRLCEFGYYFKEGDCVSCNIEGCAICDTNKVDKCYICKTDYYMNQNQICIPLSTENNKDSINKNFLLLLLFLLIN